jgi:hypothetical protein
MMKTKMCFSGIAGVILVMVCLGCATIKTNDSAIIGITANTVSEGIKVTFTEIPLTVNRVFISFADVNEITVNRRLTALADIRGEQLEQIRTSRTLICPFVQNGNEYLIAAFLLQDNEQDIVITSTGTAGGEIRPRNSPTLDINKELIVATLSEEPLFSTNVQYAPERYSYELTVLKDDITSYSYREKSSELLCDLSAMGEYFAKDGIQIAGLSAFVTVFSNLIYDNITWGVGIATSELFTVGL